MQWIFAKLQGLPRFGRLFKTQSREQAPFLNAKALLFLVTGLIFLCLGIAFGCRNILFVVSSEKASGEIEQVNEVWLAPKEPSDKPRLSFQPVFTFRTLGGVEHTVTQAWSSSFKYGSGQKIPVYYKATEPSDAEIGNFITLALGPLVYTAGGLLIMAATVIWRLIATRSKL
jgi:hypothetical protein